MLNDVYCYYVEPQDEMTVVFAVSLDDYVPIGLLPHDCEAISHYVSTAMLECLDLLPLPNGREFFPEYMSEFA